MVETSLYNLVGILRLCRHIETKPNVQPTRVEVRNSTQIYTRYTHEDPWVPLLSGKDPVREKYRSVISYV